jgi:myosin heavy subunit
MADHLAIPITYDIKNAARYQIGDSWGISQADLALLSQYAASGAEAQFLEVLARYPSIPYTVGQPLPPAPFGAIDLLDATTERAMAFDMAGLLSLILKAFGEFAREHRQFDLEQSLLQMSYMLDQAIKEKDAANKAADSQFIADILGAVGEVLGGLVEGAGGIASFMQMLKSAAQSAKANKLHNEVDDKKKNIENFQKGVQDEERVFGQDMQELEQMRTQLQEVSLRKQQATDELEQIRAKDASQGQAQSAEVKAAELKIADAKRQAEKADIDLAACKERREEAAVKLAGAETKLKSAQEDVANYKGSDPAEQQRLMDAQKQASIERDDLKAQLDVEQRARADLETARREADIQLEQGYTELRDARQAPMKKEIEAIEHQQAQLVAAKNDYDLSLRDVEQKKAKVAQLEEQLQAANASGNARRSDRLQDELDQANFDLAKSIAYKDGAEQKLTMEQNLSAGSDAKLKKLQDEVALQENITAKEREVYDAEMSCKQQEQAVKDKEGEIKQAKKEHQDALKSMQGDLDDLTRRLREAQLGAQTDVEMGSAMRTGATALSHLVSGVLDLFKAWQNMAAADYRAEQQYADRMYQLLQSTYQFLTSAADGQKQFLDDMKGSLGRALLDIASHRTAFA